MEIKIRELTTNQEVLNSARTTVWREDLMKEPTKQFMKDIYMAEHSPIRCKMFMIEYHGIKRWIADHLVRHKNTSLALQKAPEGGLDAKKPGNTRCRPFPTEFF